VSSSLPIALVIHGHFYQPPRENPWTDEVPREPSAAPHHDWNARIHAESYRANAFARIHAGDGRIQAIVNGYERLSFNFGPTLARWIGRHDAPAEARLRAADAEQRKRLGAGGAVAQAYAHPIVPLCDAADRRTQLLWGLHDFQRRFGRPADGLWLPETAVSPATLATLIDLGVKFTILGPEQIDGVRDAAGSAQDGPWRKVDRDTLDTGRAYLWRHPDGSGRTIALAVFDGALSRAVAFGEASSRAESLLDAVRTSAEGSKVAGQRLVLCASDGELWGHHKKFADLTLSFATHVEAARRGIDVTNLGAYLARHPPTWEARLAAGPDGEGTAWSCAHGLGRWKSDCGCNMDGSSGWNQAWRGPLRRGLDLIRDAAGAFYEDAASELLWDPWGARDEYGAVVDDPRPVRDRALAAYGRPALAAGGERTRTRARLLLELQRATLLMYASCGWFFDDIAGLEASLILRIGAHALDLLHQAGGSPPLPQVLDALAEGRSNRREAGTGADVFRRMALHRVTPAHAVAGAALEALVAPSASEAQIVPGFDVTVSGTLTEQPSGARSLRGAALVRQRRVGVCAETDFVATVRRGGVFEARVGGESLTLADLGDEARGALVLAALPSLLPDLLPSSEALPLARLVVAAARELPPDGDTPAGVARRALLARALLALLGTGTSAASPGAEALGLSAVLLDLLALPAASPDRRAIEERVWELHDRGRPSAALRMLADKLGFAPAEPVVETAAS
jgi:alpha-amylase/alpha-mannosidase (GH57 family)